MNKTNNTFKSKTEYTKGVLTEVKKNWIPLPYRISTITSESKPNSAGTIINNNTHTNPTNQGWYSSKQCSFPQEIQLYFPQEVILRQIQILLHQYIIPSRIDIFIDQPNSIIMKKIGHITPNDNQKTNYKSRELKSVFTEHHCTKLKLALMQNYSNDFNTHCQVGMISLALLGTYAESKDKVFVVCNEEMKNGDDEVKYESVISGEMKLRELMNKKKIAIDEEDYEKAKEVKEQIDQANIMITSLKVLEERKMNAIENEDYDEAKGIKLKIDEVRLAMLEIGQCNKDRDKKDNTNSPLKNNIEPLYNKLEQPEDKVINQQEEIELEKEKEEEAKSVIVKASNEPKIVIENNNNKEKNQVKAKNKVGLFLDIMNNKEHLTNNKEKKEVKANKIYKENKDNKPSKVNINKTEAITTTTSGISNNNHHQMSEIKDNHINNNKQNKDINKNKDKPNSIYDDIIYNSFSPSITKMLFNSDWKVKENCLTQIQEDIIAFPQSTIFTSTEEELIIQGIIAICNYILELSNIQLLLVGLDLVICLNSSPLVKAHYAIDQLPIDCLKILFDHLGDIHLRVQEKVEVAIISFSNFSCIGSNRIMKQLVNGPITKRLLNSSKHITARYNLLYKLIESFGLPKQSDDLFENIINIVKKGIDSNKKDIRDAAFTIIIPLYNVTGGNNLRKRFEGIRQQSLNQYDEIAKGFKGESDRINNNNNNNNNQHGCNNNNDKDNDIKDNNNDNEIDDNKKGDLCLFCRSFNGTIAQMKIHHSTKCVMITICKKCNQMVEISNLNNHLINKCECKEQYKECPICYEAIELSDYNQHSSAKTCRPNKKEQSNSMRCPLCHQDIEGWSTHLMTHGCPKNPRKSKRGK